MLLSVPNAANRDFVDEERSLQESPIEAEPLKTRRRSVESVLLVRVRPAASRSSSLLLTRSFVFVSRGRRRATGR